MTLAILAGLVMWVLAGAVRGQETLATVTSGQLRGALKEGVHVFKGVPYGEDTAKRRFQAPVAVKKWEGVRDALEFGYMPPQNSAGGGGAGGDTFFPSPVKGTKGATASEDCLNLNLWTPAMRDGKKRPVMVYFHGGAYNNGSVNLDLYDGTRLCKRGDVVVVTVNGRLNGLGFLYLAELGGAEYADSGNVGMLDLILALQWVQGNIAEFGGDAGNVTIFGQSGGGAKCSTLMAMPAAKGLFHRVITMSGQQITGRKRENANATARAVLEKLKVGPGELGKLQTMPLEELMAGLRGGTWTPVVDGKNLPRDPFSPDASPLSAHVPMMKGNTREETASFYAGDKEVPALTWETLPEKLKRTVGQYMGDLDAKEVVARYREWYPAYGPADVFFASTTAARSWKSMLVEVNARAAQGGAGLWVYQLDWRTPVQGGRFRACHTLDIPLAFDNVALAPSMVGEGADAQPVADAMADAFIEFARKGEVKGWPRYTLEKRATLIFDRVPRVEEDPRGAERRLFEKAQYVQPGT